MDKALSSATYPGQSGLGSNGNERVLCIPQSSSITGTSPSDCFVSYTGHSLGGILPFCRGALGVFYSPSRLGNHPWYITFSNMIYQLHHFFFPSLKQADVDFTNYLIKNATRKWKLQWSGSNNSQHNFTRQGYILSFEGGTLLLRETMTVLRSRDMIHWRPGFFWFVIHILLRSHIHEYGHVQNRHVMFITIEHIKNRNLKNT